LELKRQLAQILKKAPAGVAYSDHDDGDGELIRGAACRQGLEGIVSKRADQP
jgi:bifunctional non-homologous end joining protein LigD